VVVAELQWNSTICDRNRGGSIGRKGLSRALSGLLGTEAYRRFWAEPMKTTLRRSGPVNKGSEPHPDPLLELPESDSLRATERQRPTDALDQLRYHWP